jgi:hypothetical protein
MIRRFRVEIKGPKGTERGVVTASHPRDAYTKFAMREGFVPARTVTIPKGTHATVQEVGSIAIYNYSHTNRPRARNFKRRA